jgi:hypothetical protein
MNRRLLNEKKILSFYETDKFVSVIIDENLEVGDISKFFKFRIYTKSNNNFLTVKINYNAEYPFRPPNAFIKEEPYLKLLRYNISDKDISKYLFPKWSCLCCASFLCGDNWGPSLKTTHLLNEIVDNYLLKVRITEIFFAKKIIEMYIPIHYIDTFIFDFF